MSHDGSQPVTFTCNGELVTVDTAPDESLLSVLRERLGLTSVKDGCAPQGQCGCCTVLVDGDPRVACVTPAARVAGRSVTTLEGLPAVERDALANAFVGTGGSQCGFCTPGILVRAAGMAAKGRTGRVDLDRALAAHLCRCTGWQTVYEALCSSPAPPDSRHAESELFGFSVPRTGSGGGGAGRTREREGAARRAELEGGGPQRVGPEVPLGHGGFAEDTAPRDALVAVPAPPGSTAETVGAAGLRWVVGETLLDARVLAGKVQGRRTSADVRPPLPLPELPAGGVRLATSWVEPAYLEPDASWCLPGGDPATPLANGGAFGGKVTSPVVPAARELADRLGCAVRVVFSREDVVRLGPKRPPVAAGAWLHGEVVHVRGAAAGPVPVPSSLPYALTIDARWEHVTVPGLSASDALRAVGLAEHTVLLEGALDAADADRAGLAVDERAAAALLDTCARSTEGATAGARVRLGPDTGRIELVQVRVAAGDPLDEVVLRSYAIGAAHMALGWVLTEGLAVDPVSTEVQDLTIRSFGVIRPRSTPPIEVTIVDDPVPALPRASDAVFAAVAAACWNAVARVEGRRPEAFPARETRAARMLRR